MLYPDGEPCDKCGDDIVEVQKKLVKALDSVDTDMLNKVSGLLAVLYEGMGNLGITYGQLIDHMNWVFATCQEVDEEGGVFVEVELEDDDKLVN